MRGLPTYRTDSSVLAKATALGFAVALSVGVIWGYAPAWGFYLALVLGFGVAESMASAAKGKRGRDLQAAAIGAVLIGLLISRGVLAQRLGIGWDAINELTPYVEQTMRLRPIPDGLFAALSVAIVWFRFR